MKHDLNHTEVKLIYTNILVIVDKNDDTIINRRSIKDIVITNSEHNMVIHTTKSYYDIAELQFRECIPNKLYIEDGKPIDIVGFDSNDRHNLAVKPIIIYIKKNDYEDLIKNEITKNKFELYLENVPLNNITYDDINKLIEVKKYINYFCIHRDELIKAFNKAKSRFIFSNEISSDIFNDIINYRMAIKKQSLIVECFNSKKEIEDFFTRIYIDLIDEDIVNIIRAVTKKDFISPTL